MDMFQKKPSFLSQRIDEKNRLKESVAGGHRTGLGDKLLQMFAPREPVRYVPVPTPKPKAVPLSGLAGYTQFFSDSEAKTGDAAGGSAEAGAAPAPPEQRLFRSPELALQARVEQETKPERDIRRAAESKAAAREAAREGRSQWDPAADINVQGDPLRTLFVGRLAYETTERRLRRELEEFGPIRSIRIVHDTKSGKPRGYAFVEFEHKNDMKEAYKAAEGRKLDGRRILVDVERGRVVPGWLPRRLGGVKGGESRADKQPKDPMRLFVRRMIEKHLEERDRAAREAEEPGPAEEAPRDRPNAVEGHEDRGRSRSRERRPRSVEPQGRARSPEQGLGRDRARERSRSPGGRRDRGRGEDDYDYDRRRRGRQGDNGYDRRRGRPVDDDDDHRRGRQAEEDDRNYRAGSGRRHASDDDSGSDREAGELPQQKDAEDHRSRSRQYDDYDDGDRHGDRKRERDGSYDKGSKRMRERDPVYA